MSCSRNSTRFGGLGSLALVLLVLPVNSQAEEADLPQLKFFYFDSDRVEWVVSSDKKAFAEHLRDNAESRRFVSTLRSVVLGDEPLDAARSQVRQWIAEQREAFDRTSGSNTTRFRKAEGIVAYLRAHDFSVRNLVQSLKERTGASAVELAGIHRVGGRDGSTFQMKVVLVDAKIDLGRKGFNVDVQSASTSYVPVVYALGLALYEVQELTNAELPAEEIPAPAREVEEARAAADPPADEIDEVVADFQ